MDNNKLISPHISPRILGNVASMYNEISRVFMEFIDNSIDSAESFYQPRENNYNKDIEIKVEYSGSTKKSGQIVITDNCTGMDKNGLLRIIKEIGNSDKKEQPWTNGQFGYGIYSFLSVCEDIEIISKIENHKPEVVKLNRNELEKDHLEDVKIEAPKQCLSQYLEYKSGTKVILKKFDKVHWKDIDLRELTDEIEKHFELLLSRNKINISIFKNSELLHVCKAFDYDRFNGDYYREDVDTLIYKSIRGGTKKYYLGNNPIKILVKITEEEDINKRPVIISKGRRISEIKDLRSFRISKNKQAIWNHPNLTGYIEVQDFISPNIARNDFRNNDKSKALYQYLINLEDLIKDLIDTINKETEEKHYKKLEDALNQALSQLAKLDITTLRYRTEIISGNSINLEPGTSGGQIIADEGGAKDRGDGKSGSSDNVGENEGDGAGPKAGDGNIPGGSSGDDSSNTEAENPYDDTGLTGKKTRKSGFNVRIVDRPPDNITDERTGQVVQSRSRLAGDTIEIFKIHPDFQIRIGQSRTKSHKITQRLITYLSGEMTVHYKDMFNNKMGQAEYNKWMFVDLTESIYLLEDMLAPLVGKNLSDLEENNGN